MSDHAEWHVPSEIEVRRFVTQLEAMEKALSAHPAWQGEDLFGGPEELGDDRLVALGRMMDLLRQRGLDSDAHPIEFTEVNLLLLSRLSQVARALVPLSQTIESLFDDVNDALYTAGATYNGILRHASVGDETLKSQVKKAVEKWK